MGTRLSLRSSKGGNSTRPLGQYQSWSALQSQAFIGWSRLRVILRLTTAVDGQSASDFNRDSYGVGGG